MTDDGDGGGGAADGTPEHGTPEHVDLLSRALVPVAHPDDARDTCRALAPYGPLDVTAVHVVEKGGGAPDKTPVEQSEELAAEAFEVVHEWFPGADTEVRYGTDVVDTVLETAADVGATAVVFLPREGGRIVRLLSGDLTLDLVTHAELPVVALPRPEDVDDGGRDETADGPDTEGR